MVSENVRYINRKYPPIRQIQSMMGEIDSRDLSRERRKVANARRCFVAFYFSLCEAFYARHSRVWRLDWWVHGGGTGNCSFVQHSR